MRNFNKFEKMLLSLGLLLAITSAFVFFFQAERLGVWLGFLVESQTDPLGRLEYSTNSVRRKPMVQQNFVNLNYQQKVFDRDTIMTGDDAEAIFSLNDGGVLNIGPNSVVQLIKREANSLDGSAPQVVLVVKKGEITGTSGGKEVKVESEDGKAIELQKPKPTSLLAQVDKKKKVDLKNDCQVKVALASLGEVSLSAQCNGMDNTTARVSIYDSKQKLVVKGQDIPAKVKFPAPGAYRVRWESTFADEQTITVPSEWLGISFLSQNVGCDGHIQWQYSSGAPAAPTDKFMIDSPSLGRSNPVINGGSANVSEILSTFPNQLRVKTAANSSGFFYVSPILKLAHGPTCNELVFPKNHSVQKPSVSGARTLFTWKQRLGQDQVKFELSTDPDFNKIIFTQVVRKNYARVALSRPAMYYWRVTDLKTNERSLVSQVKVSPTGQ